MEKLSSIPYHALLTSVIAQRSEAGEANGLLNHNVMGTGLISKPVSAFIWIFLAAQ